MSKVDRKRFAPDSINVILDDREKKALMYLRNFPDFKSKSNKLILKTCLAIVAIDAANKVQEFQDKQAELEKKEKENV